MVLGQSLVARPVLTMGCRWSTRRMCSTAHVLSCCERNLCIHESNSAGPSPARQGFVGGYTVKVTPVPIPNTVVKLHGPMILLQRESRLLPAFKLRPPVPKSRGFFFGRDVLVIGEGTSRSIARCVASWQISIQFGSLSLGLFVFVAPSRRLARSPCPRPWSWCSAGSRRRGTGLQPGRC